MMMKLRFPLLLYALLALSAPARAQHTATQPVLSAAPAPASNQGLTSSKGLASNKGVAGNQVQPPSSPAAKPGARSGSGGVARVSADYVLAPDDNVEVTVWKEPSLSGTLPIRPDGMITLSLLGDLPAAGSTPMQLSEEITTRLKKYVTDPRVTVTVLGVHVDRIFLLGEVGHVGALELVPGMTPLQAISSAGGLTLYANAKRIYILRNQKGRQVRIPFDYKKALKTGDEQGVSLIAGDTIVVP
jgi:polysaccharide export outer membrane protein